MISIHAPREGSDDHETMLDKRLGISIHAPREGSDYLWPEMLRVIQISIHAPREGSDYHITIINAELQYFNPRSP